MSEEASKGMFPKPEKLRNHSNEGKLRKGEKERTRRRKGGEKKKQWQKKKAKGQFGDKVIKNQASYVYIYIFLANK